LALIADVSFALPSVTLVCPTSRSCFATASASLSFFYFSLPIGLHPGQMGLISAFFTILPPQLSWHIPFASLPFLSLNGSGK